MSNKLIESKESYNKVILYLVENGYTNEGKIVNKIESLREVITPELIEKNGDDYYLAMLDYLKEVEEKVKMKVKVEQLTGFSVSGVTTGRRAMSMPSIRKKETDCYNKEELEQMTEIILEYIPNSIKMEFKTGTEAVKEYLKMLRARI